MQNLTLYQNISRGTRGRIDIVVNHEQAFEQVHIIDGGHKKKLISSVGFDSSNLGGAASDRGKLIAYARVTLASAIHKWQKGN